jgi:hypothetical protein
LYNKGLRQSIDDCIIRVMLFSTSLSGIHHYFHSPTGFRQHIE